MRVTVSELKKVFPARMCRVTLIITFAQHNTTEDAWSAFNGRVYNITPYLDFHPGGVKELMRCAGRDGTKLFSRSLELPLIIVNALNSGNACLGQCRDNDGCLSGRHACPWMTAIEGFGREDTWRKTYQITLSGRRQGSSITIDVAWMVVS